MISLNKYILLEAEGEQSIFQFEHDDTSITINCEYCTIIVDIDNVSYTTKSGKEIWSGKELVELLDQGKDQEISWDVIKGALNSKKDDFKEIFNDVKKNPYHFITIFKDAQLWPPGTENLRAQKIDLYQTFTLKLHMFFGQSIPEIDLGDLVISGIGKIKTKQLLTKLIKLSGTLHLIIYNIAKDFCGSDDKGSFDKLRANIIKNIKKVINDNIKEINSLPDTVEK